MTLNCLDVLPPQCVQRVMKVKRRFVSLIRARTFWFLFGVFFGASVMIGQASKVSHRWVVDLELASMIDATRSLTLVYRDIPVDRYTLHQERIIIAAANRIQSLHAKYSKKPSAERLEELSLSVEKIRPYHPDLAIFLEELSISLGATGQTYDSVSLKTWK